MRKRLASAGNALAVFGTLLLLWQLVIWIFHVQKFMLPSPWAVGKAVVARFPSLLTSLLITAEESLGGLIASIIVGVLVALVFAQSRWVRRMLFPYTILLQTVPILAIAPLILMWVGAGTAAVTFIAFIISLAPIIANTTQGLISVDENLVNLFLMHNASPAQMLLKLRLPHAVPSLFVGGEKDGPTRWGGAAIANFSKTLPELRGSHVLSGCGHWVQQERAHEVNELLVKFVKGL